MNISELEQIMGDAGIDICPVCGTPYSKFHSRQRTCGAEECKRVWKNKYLRERRERLIAEDKELFNHIHTKAQQKYRLKKRGIKEVSETLDRMQEHWNSVFEKDVRLSDGGLEYGKRQIENTLASVPKIDVSGFGKERKE